MESSDGKRFKYEVVKEWPALRGVVVSYDVIDRDTAYNLLKQTNVRDAMKFVIAVSRDARYTGIVTEMRAERIWKYWMQRDLKIIMNAMGNKLPAWITENKTETAKPQWKLCYLWYRLVVGANQWNIIRELVKYDDLDMYPPGSTIEYVHLNVLKLTVPKSFKVESGTTLLNFRKEFPRIYPYWQNDNNMVKYNLRTANMLETPFTEFLIAKGYADSRQGTEAADAIVLHTIVDIFSSNPPSSITWGFHPGQDFWKLVGRFPRALRYTSILVAGPVCAYCNNESPGYQCDKYCGTHYCGVECQTAHWETKHRDYHFLKK